MRWYWNHRSEHWGKLQENHHTAKALLQLTFSTNQKQIANHWESVLHYSTSLQKCKDFTSPQQHYSLVF